MSVDAVLLVALDERADEVPSPGETRVADLVEVSVR